jgi:hypothetical protein
MKRCPACGSTFTDDSLRFCLQDGATLLGVSGQQSPDFNPAETLRDDSESHGSEEPPPTEKFNLGTALTVQARPAAETVPVLSPRSTRGGEDERAAGKRSNPLVVASVTAVVVLLLVLTGFGLVYLLRDKTSGGANTSTAPANTQQANGTPANTGGPPADANVNNRNAIESKPETRAADSPVRITASASSTREPVRDNSYLPSNVLDGSLLTAWIEGADGPGTGEWLRCDFDREVKLRRILITPGYFKTTELWSQNNRLAAATFYFSDGTSRRYTFPDRMQEQRLDTGNVKTRWVRMVIDETYEGSVDSEDTPVSQMTFEFGE